MGICGNCGEKSVLKNLHALERCNVHGIWETYKEIEVMSGEGEEGKKVRLESLKSCLCATGMGAALENGMVQLIWRFI